MSNLKNIVACNFCPMAYDMSKAKVTKEEDYYTSYITPCCHKPADSREFKDNPDYSLINGLSWVFIDNHQNPCLIVKPLDKVEPGVPSFYRVVENYE